MLLPLYLTTQFPQNSSFASLKRKHDDSAESDNYSSDSDSDSDCSSSPDSRPRKLLSPSRRIGPVPGIPADEPLDIDSRIPMPVPAGRRPRSRALMCPNHSWNCTVCGK
ncbi:uncharacterized protein H6S33_001266 [Morchella sextelata]|uniref:uncharacterized protein n=1 Tax=Morchella sextelata TaxID=1174677 RepID=UPI001D03939C|nr:uncharacterized protein H6S33_001266 [Morchella sextelata]KAH0609038.1 hypothetical protein H6S33_001266 [Morchella sextelata]